MIAALAIRWLGILGLFVGGILCGACGHLAIGAGLHALLVGYLLAGTLNPSSRLFGPVQTECEKGIWLTLDDGPDPIDTPVLLDLLDQYQAKATFFVIGQKAAEYPALIREIHRRGHQIGNHSWSHPRSIFWCLGPIRTYREIAKCQQTITDILGSAPTVFRAPVGHYNLFVHPVIKHLGVRLVDWNCRGFDGVSSSSADVRKRIRATMADRSIVLAHESTPIAREVVTDILDTARENGWPCLIP